MGNFDTTGLKKTVRSLSNGVREFVVLFPDGDLSRDFQMITPSAGALKTKRPAMSLMGNLWLYVTDQSNPRQKGDDTWVDPPENAEDAAAGARNFHV